jgi:glutamine synthetase
MNVHYLVGFETEFILLQKTEDILIKAVNEHPWSASRALLSGSPEATCMEAIVDALEQCGITVEMYHAEAAPGQVRACPVLLYIESKLTSKVTV